MDDKKKNNSDYGLSLQKAICNCYEIEVNEWAAAQFKANYNDEYEEEFNTIIPIIFKTINWKPVHLLTYTRELIRGKQTTSPHNFLLDNGQTLSLRTTKTSDKVAPRTVGQAGFPVLNDFFGDLFGREIKNQSDVRKLIYEHIHEMLPIFIDHMFISDFTVFLSRKNIDEINVIKASEVANYSFSREEFTFTKDLEDWTESTTLKYHGVSIAEIQTHKERSFKFRFIVSAIPTWFMIVKENNETFGMSAEAAICQYFSLVQPESFKTRALKKYIDKLLPVIDKAFKEIPAAIEHSGSRTGDRGEQSKCSYDFVLTENRTLSLKTNKGKMVCPPEVGQPGSSTCLLYFGDFFEPGTNMVNADNFKKMVYENIDKIMPIYVEHLFDSDWLLWIYETKKEGYQYQAISKEEVKKFDWDKSKFTFTKPEIAEWNESNTVKYDGLSIGEFQVHQNRNCFKFRFNMKNLLDLILK